MIGVWSMKKDGTGDMYFAQVYRGSSEDAYYITSAEALVSNLDTFESIDHLVILSHSFDESVAFGKTPKQLQAMLAPVLPKITTLTLDGCSAGRVPVQLWDMAVALDIHELQAWTYFHHFEVWGRPARKEDHPDPNEDIDAVLQFASAYVPRGSSGATIPAEQMKAQLDSEHTFSGRPWNRS